MVPEPEPLRDDLRLLAPEALKPVTEPKPIPAKGTTRYDLKGMPDEDFERMVGRLVRLEFPEAIKPANTADGGADMALPKEGGGYERCWQSKHYPGAINWTQCKKSLAAAMKNWDPSHYTFCFPRELTSKEQQTFDKHFRGEDADIKVDYWSGEELQARLVGSDEGQRVVRTFFGDGLDPERMYQAMEAGGRLDTKEDALDRMSNLGEFLSGGDAFFSYPGATHESEGPGPPLTEGTVMSFAKSDGKVTSRVDVVPRDPEAVERYGPEFVLSPTDDEKGREAAARLQEALSEGKPVAIEEGLDMTFTRLPPGLDEFRGKRLTGGRIELGKPQRVRRPLPRWDARLRAETDAGKAMLDVSLKETADVPEDWDGALVGTRGGLTVTALFRQRANRGEINWNFKHARDDSPVREQLDALRFLSALSGQGELLIRDRGASARPDMRVPTPRSPVSSESRALLTFLEDVRVIEEWAGMEFTLPETVMADEARWIGQVADVVRNKGRSLTWHEMHFTIREEGVPQLREGGVLRVEHPVAVRIFGQLVDLGYQRFQLTDYTVSSAEPAPDQPGHQDVRIEPKDADGQQMFELLVKEQTRSRPPPPPPPPPRKRRRKSSGKKGKRKRK